MSHWCKDIERDEAVRAAEDGRSGPLPTLEKAIAQAFGFDEASVQRACDETKTWPADIQVQAKKTLANLLEQGVPRLQALSEASRWGKRLFEARYPAMIPKTGSPSSAPEQENKGDDMATKAEIQAADYRAEAAERITQALTADRFAAAVAEADTLRARVAELEGQLESVACRAATAETALEAAKAAPAASDAAGWREVLMEIVAAAEGVRDWAGPPLVRDEERYLLERDVLNAAIASAEKLLNAPAAAPAASGAAGTEVVSAEQPPSGYVYEYPHYPPPVATVIRFTGGETINGSKPLRAIPYWFAPQPAKGWLTEEERELIAGITDDDDYTEEGQNIAKAILARSSPPEVVAPASYAVEHPQPPRDLEWRKALAAAGVTVKEVK